MRNTLIALAISVFALTSCGKKDAFKFSQDIVKIEQSLVPDITRTETQVGNYFQSENYDSAAAVSARMEKIVDGKLKEVEALKTPDVPEAENFKAASVRYFSFIKSMYTVYKDFAAAPTDEVREKERTNLQKLLTDKNKAIADMQNAQKKYAEANKFKIEK